MIMGFHNAYNINQKSLKEFLEERRILHPLRINLSSNHEFLNTVRHFHLQR